MKESKLLIVIILLIVASRVHAQNSVKTIALWPFDEQVGIYPSCVISDVSDNDYPLVLGPGGQIVPGKYGNALEPKEQPEIEYPDDDNVKFGLHALPVPAGRTIEPMNWMNANFCALMTKGENHLRKQVGFVHPTKTKLNLGQFDWTIEFWYQPTNTTENNAVVFEIGQGPRGENEVITQLILDSEKHSFILVNTPGNVLLQIPTDPEILNIESGEWNHFAFVYNSDENQLSHYANGEVQPKPEKSIIISLPEGEEDYMSVGRDGIWNNPLPGRIDELCFSEGLKYQADFNPPASMSYIVKEKTPTEKISGNKLLFVNENLPVMIGSRKHLFIDDVLIADIKNVSFNVNPPRMAERVIENIKGPFRKHLNVLEDAEGLIRMYNAVDDD